MSLLPISSPHQHGPARTQKVMLQVIWALIPAILLHVWLFDWGILFNIVLLTLFSLGVEAAMLYLRRRPILPAISDGSAAVTAILLALTIPPLSPWWICLIGAIIAIGLAKQLYGGLGFNPFNPAMVAYVALLISFPQQLTQWQAPLSHIGHDIAFIEAAVIVFNAAPMDTLTYATPLDNYHSGLTIGQSIDNLDSNQLFRVFGGVANEQINLLILLGGLYLLWRGTIRWQVPVAMLATLFLLSSLFYLIDSDRFASPLFHLLGGGAMLGAFFIATDPVSGATSERGRLIFGAGVGLFTFIIRTWGGYPDGVAFAVLLMNMAAPTIDYYTRPPVFGQPSRQ
ncbi:RnfABCDGE type electron transport complex subunit D [Ectothiorhodospiraceae bacterium BW-2]|nr:RnfABCDGE type electron transport complex subunit D [Ectothiorhodospiraceae bacterium BW-2]